MRYGEMDVLWPLVYAATTYRFVSYTVSNRLLLCEGEWSVSSGSYTKADRGYIQYFNTAAIKD